MTHLLRASIPAVLLVLAGGCEKADSTSIEGSGGLTDAERALLAYLPAGGNLAFGGNYKKFMEYWETSPLRTFTEAMTTAAGDPNGIRDYMNCWMEQQTATDMAGALEVKPGGVAMTMVFRGVNEKILTTCADKGGLKYERDPDGKYVELKGLSDGRGGTSDVGYYFVAPDIAFFAVDVPLGAAGALPMPKRADLEAMLARANAAPAANSPEFQALVARADRSKSFWFAGTSAGTPLASTVIGGHGWIDADKDALTIGFSVELSDPDAASQAVAKFEEAKKSVGMLPPELKKAVEAFLRDARLTASGKALNGRFRITNQVLEQAIPAVQGMAGGL